MVVNIPRPRAYTLDNGLEVVLAPHPRAHNVSVAVGYRVGHRDDPRGYEGMAHLVEHMTYRGSVHLPDGDYDHLVERAGGRANAFTSTEHTVYWVDLPAEQLPLGLWLESERMGFTLSRFNETALGIEKRVVQAEHDTSGPDMVRETIQRAVYPDGHPYRHTADARRGTEDVTLDNLRWFYQAHYRPENARLVIAGRFEEAVARDLVDRFFASLRPSGARARRVAATAVQLEGNLRVRARVAGTRRDLSLRWYQPCRDLRCRVESQALAAYLARADASPLARALRFGDPPLVAALSAHATQVGDGVELRIDATLASEAKEDAVREALWNALRAARSVDESRWRTLRLGLANDYVRGAEGALSRATRLAVDRPGTKPTCVHDELSELMSITPTRLSARARQWLDDEHYVLVVTDPHAGKKLSVRGKARPRVVP